MESDVGAGATGFGPREVSRLLGVSTSTLRTYAAKFDRLLSARARGGVSGDGAGFSHRRYAASDLQLLRRAKALLDAGLSYEATFLQLDDGGILSRRLPPTSTRRRARRLPVSPAPSDGTTEEHPTGAPRSAESASDQPPPLAESHPVNAESDLARASPGESLGVTVVTEAQPTTAASADVALGDSGDVGPGPDVVDLVRVGVEAAIAPLREDVADLKVQLEVLAEQVANLKLRLEDLTEEERAQRRLAADGGARLARAQRRLDEIAGALNQSPPEQRSWLRRLLSPRSGR